MMSENTQTAENGHGAVEPSPQPSPQDGRGSGQPSPGTGEGAEGKGADESPRGRNVVMRVTTITVIAICFLAVGTWGSRVLGPSRRAGAAVSSHNDARQKAAFNVVEGRGIIPVPPTGIKTYAISHEDDPGSMMALYSSRSLPPETVVDFYSAEMPRYGWKEIGAYEEQLKNTADVAMLFFRQPGRECIIHVGKGTRGAEWTIILRPVIIGGGSK